MANADAPLPALVVSASQARYERAAAHVARYGFASTRSPAIFADLSNRSGIECARKAGSIYHRCGACEGLNGHRLALRLAWQTIVKADRAMAVFEDDAIAALGGEETSIRIKVRIFIDQWQQSHDVLYLGGIGRTGICASVPKGIGPGRW